MTNTILFSNITALTEDGKYNEGCFVATDGKNISYIGNVKPKGKFDRIIDGTNKLIMPGLYNMHTHLPMTLFRSYGEDLPLDRWLNEKIFPADDKLTGRAVYNASLLSCAEMIKNGIVSFSDMYFFCEDIIKAVSESEMKANISRSITSFDENADFANDKRLAEAKALASNYHNSYDNRIIIDMSLHAEYTNTEKMCMLVADYARENNLAIQIHLSETEKEHIECKERRGMTPTAFFYKTGVLDCPVIAAHCVYVEDDDISMLKEKNVTVVHNPVSNLKLGSGVMNIKKLMDNSVNITLGTDGCASNNTLDILKEMNYTATLHKGINKKADLFDCSKIISFVTQNSAKAQRRNNSGKLKCGYSADLTVIDMDTVNNIPSYSPIYTVLYSASNSDVYMTVCNGKILYENKEFKTLDIEKIKYNMKKTVANYFN